MSTAHARILPAMAVRYQDLATRLGYCFLLLIACFSPWGHVLRLGGDEGPVGRGLTTILAIGIILVSLLSGRLFSTIVARPRVLFFAVFVFLATLASLMQDVPLSTSFRGAFNRGGYWILMVGVMSLHLGSDKGSMFARIFAVSTALMAMVSLIDYFHIVDVPGFNEGTITFRVNPNKLGTDVGRALIGPFASRSILAPYLALAWPVSVMELVHGRSRHPLRSVLWAGVLASLTLAIMVCYSRALYLTVVFGAIYVVYSSGYRRILRIVFLVVPVLFVLFLVAQSKFPHEMSVLAHRIASLAPSRVVESGAGFRISNLQTTVSELLRSPQGMGFGYVQFGQAEYVVHSVFIEHLRPAGWVGFLLVCLFAWPVLKTIVSRRNPVGTMVLCASLVGVLAYGVAHSTHDMLGIWIVVGLLYHLESVAGKPGAPGQPGIPPVGTRTGWRSLHLL